MNAQEIYQSRIDEAAKRYAWSHDTIGVDKGTFHTEASQKAPIPIHNEVRIPIYHEMEIAFKCAAHFILKNQWISVDEALPEKIKDKNYSEYVLVRQEYYEHEYHVIARYDYGFNMWVSTTYFKPEFITHWMEIPSLEGGEK